MKKFKPFLSFTLLIALLEILGLIVVTMPGIWLSSAYHSNRITALLGAVWIGGMIILCFAKGKVKKSLYRMIKIGNLIAGGALLAISLIFILALCHPYQGRFSTTTSLFDDKNILVIVPHQDDEINIVGGLIEQYVEGGSEVSVVFTTIGDYVTDPNIRAAEVVDVLTTLGVEQETFIIWASVTTGRPRSSTIPKWAIFTTAPIPTWHGLPAMAKPPLTAPIASPPTGTTCLTPETTIWTASRV